MEFRKCILTITREAVPLEEQLQRIKKDPWQTKKVKRQFLLRDQAFKLYHQLRTPAGFAVLQEQRNRAIHMQRKERMKFEARFAQRAASQPKIFFAHAQKQKKLKNQVVTMRDETGERITDPLRQAQLFADTFHRSYRADDGRAAPTCFREAIRMPPVEIHVSLVQRALVSFNTHKGAGPDDVHPVILRVLAPFIAQRLTDLFNLSLRTASDPDDWRSATVCPILKKATERMQVTTDRSA